MKLKLSLLSLYILHHTHKTINQITLVLNQITQTSLQLQRKIHISDDEIIENGTLLIQDGVVIKSGKEINIPKNCVVINARGKFYTCLLLMFSQVLE